MRIGLAQINPTVGDLSGNRRRIVEAYHALVAQGAELVRSKSTRLNSSHT